MTKKQSLAFLASLPEIMSAIKTGSDGMRITLDIPETQVGNAVELIGMRGKVLRVMVELADKVDGKYTTENDRQD